MRADVAFLFLGETLLIPHLYPVLEALVERAPDLRVDVWVATSMHEALVAGWLGARPGVRIRRAPGWRDLGAWEAGRNPPLPAKLPLLARLAPLLWRTRVVVSAEQTSLWIPALLPTRSRYVNILHGAGSMMNRDDRRRKAATLTIVAAERERAALAAHGVDPAAIAVTGYIKAGFRQRSRADLRFAEQRPVLLYAPHWQRHRSSWWEWGEATVERIVASGRYNLIFAPHQRLAEKVPELRAFADEHGIALVSIEDLQVHRRLHESQVDRLATTRLPTEFGEFAAHGYRDRIEGSEHIALVHGDPGTEDVLVRIHSECLTGDVFGSRRCDCGPQLELSMTEITAAGAGIVVYLRGHEGRGIGLLHKLQAYALQDTGSDTVDANIQLGFGEDERDYAAGAQILRDLGVTSVRLLTNNPDKTTALEAYGVKVSERLPLVIAPTEDSLRYLQTKAERMGHDLPGLEENS